MLWAVKGGAQAVFGAEDPGAGEGGGSAVAAGCEGGMGVGDAGTGGCARGEWRSASRGGRGWM